MEKKQSSVEWFLNEFSKQIEFVPESELDKWYKELIPIAKAMHKEEIENSYDYMRCIGSFTNGKEYYNETFGDEKVL